MTPQPGTAGTDDDPLDSIETEELVVNGEVIDTLVGLAFDSASATDGVLRFDGSGSTNGITDGSAKVLVNGTVHDVAGGEWVDFSGTSHSLDSWEKVVNSQFDVTITGTNGPVAPGSTPDVTADVTNNGTDSDTQTVTLDIGNGVGQVDSASVTLSGGGAVTKTLSWSVPSSQAEQDYTATVSSADDTASQTVTVRSGPPPSLVSRWTFDDADTNSGTAIDTVGSNDGAIQGATTGVSGIAQYNSGESYNFNSSNGEYVSVPSDASLEVGGAAGFSWSFWARSSDIDSADGQTPNSVFIGRGNFDNGGYMIRANNSNDVELVVRDNSGRLLQPATTAIKYDDTPQHVVCVYRGTSADIFVNGSLEASVSDNSHGDVDLTNKFYIGARAGSKRFVNGDIDDVRVYDKALTSTEVSNLYNNGRI